MRYRITTVCLVVMVITTVFQTSLISAASVVEWKADHNAWSQVESGEEQKQVPQAQVAGNIYYVAKNGSDKNDGSEDSPWLTIQHAADVMQAGDTVYVKNGVYNETVIPRRSGSHGAFITYKAYLDIGQL